MDKKIASIAGFIGVLASIAVIVGTLLALNVIHPFPSPSNPSTQTLIGSPTPINRSITQKAPGCEAPDPRISWTTNQATLQCQGGITLLTKTVSWNGKEDSRLGQLILGFPYQAFPTKFTIVVTVLNLSDPAGPGYNHGGCGSVTVHISTDRRSYDSLYVCKDGTFGYSSVANDYQIKANESTLAQSPTGQYVLTISVDGQNIEYIVNNTNNGNQTMNFQSTFQSSSGISLDQHWRNAGATAGFEDFSFNS